MKYPELYKNTLIVISAYCSHICIIVFDPFARTVTGPPVDDPKGRWRRYHSVTRIFLCRHNATTFRILKSVVLLTHVRTY